MTAETDLLPLPPLWIVPSVEPADYPDVAQALMDYARANVAHATAAKDAEIEALRLRIAGLRQVAENDRARAERLEEALQEAADDLERGIDARIVVAQLRARADLLRDQEEGHE